MLRAEAMEGIAQLQQASTPDYAYMRMQLVMHSEAEVLVERIADLVPDEGFAGFEDFVDDTADKIEEHRDHAEDVLVKL